MLDEYFSVIGWIFLPDMITTLVHKVFYSVFYSGDKETPQAGTAKYQRHRRHIYSAIVVAYLAYTIVETESGFGLNYYNRFDVSPSKFEEKQLRRSYHKLSLQLHPDRNQEDSDLNNEIFRGHQEAYECLSHPIKRFAYERFGEEALKSCTNCVTRRDYVSNETYDFAIFYISAGIVLFVINMLGRGQFARYWRIAMFITMGAIEAKLITAAERSAVLNLLLPNHTTAETVSLLHHLFFTTFMMLSQIGPMYVYVPEDNPLPSALVAEAFADAAAKELIKLRPDLDEQVEAAGVQ